MNQVTGMLLALIWTKGVTGCSTTTTELFALYQQVEYLTSPDYPGSYDSDASCHWLINAGGCNSNLAVKLTIVQAHMTHVQAHVTHVQSNVTVVQTNVTHVQNNVTDVQKQCSASCCDCLQVFDGMSDSSPSLGQVCSMFGQTVFYSTGRYMYIKLCTNGTRPPLSFRLTYESISISDLPCAAAASSVCSGYAPALSAVFGQVGYLTSPSFPTNYENSANCQRLVDAGTWDFVVKMTFLNVSMEQCSSSCCDYIHLFDGESDSSSSLITLCGMGGQTVFYSSGRYMYIKFYSDSAATNTGFRLSYEAVHRQSTITSGQSSGHVAVVVMGTVPVAIIVFLIYVRRCRRRSLRARNTYLYNKPIRSSSSSSSSSLLYTHTAAPHPAYNRMYVVSAPPAFRPYPLTGVTNEAYIPFKSAESGVAPSIRLSNE